MPEMLTAAMDYARRGYSIIPCGKNKRPLIGWDEFQKRRASEEEIRAWWRRWPSAMIALVTGPISGILIIDCDTPEGYARIQEMLPDSLILPICRTPRGGWHLWFLYPPGCGITIGAGVIPGVDYRGGGGFAVVPPSINGEGKPYRWELALDDAEPAELPAVLRNLLLNNFSYREGCCHDEQQETTKTTNDNNYFTQGRRDQDLFHAANGLVKGGCELPFIEHVIDILARNAIPPFPENEKKAKIESALKRAQRRERNLTAEIREWVMTTKGIFETTNVHREQQLTTSQEMKAANVILARLCEGPNALIERYGDRRGCYRRIENDLEPVDFLNAPTAEFPIRWPMGIEDLCSIYPGNICVVAGSKSAGKTCFLLNLVKLNMARHEVIYLNSEMGDTEFRKRLELFDDVALASWRFKAFHRQSNFADLVTPEAKIFIIDFLEITQDFWRVAAMIQEIHKKLRDGVAVIGLQKAEGKDAGRGGDFSKEKSRLYLALDYLTDQRINRIRIVDAKAWRTDKNPRGLALDYKLVAGSKFVPQTGWR